MSSDLHAYRVPILTIAPPPLTPHVFLPGIAIITNNYRDIPLRFGQAMTTAVGHDSIAYIARRRHPYIESLPLSDSKVIYSSYQCVLYLMHMCLIMNFVYQEGILLLIAR